MEGVQKMNELRLGAEPTEKEIEKAMLEHVLSIVQGDIGKVEAGIRIVLQKERDRARWIYLHNLLERKAKAKIRREREKKNNSATSVEGSL